MRATVGPGLGAEDGAHLGHVEAGSGAVDDGVEQLLHRRPVGEDQVAAVLELVDGELVAEPAAPLLVNVEPETQTGGVDPRFADLAQSPYSRIVRQGICDLSQTCGVGDRGEAVAFLDEPYAGPGGGAGDVLVAVEHHQRTEGWVPRHPDRDVTPGRVEDVKRVVVDVFGSPFDVDDDTRGWPASPSTPVPVPSPRAPRTLPCRRCEWRGSPRRRGACVHRPCRRSPVLRWPLPTP